MDSLLYMLHLLDALQKSKFSVRKLKSLSYFFIYRSCSMASYSFKNVRLSRRRLERFDWRDSRCNDSVALTDGYNDAICFMQITWIRRIYRLVSLE